MIKLLYAVSALILCCSILIFAFSQVDAEDAADELVLRPANQDLHEPIREGDVVGVMLELVNPLEESVTLTEVRASCGCMEVRSEGRTLLPGFVFAPRSSVPIEVQWDTDGRLGSLSGGVTLSVQKKSEETMITTAMFNAQVMGKMRAIPEKLVFSEPQELSPALHRIIFCDGDPNSVWEVKTVSPSADSIVGQLVALSDNEVRSLVSQDLFPKYIYQFSFDPKTRAESEQQAINFTITNVGGAEERELEVAIDWIGHSEQFYSTRVAYFGRNSTTGESREILLRSRKPIAKSLHLVTVPRFVDVRITPKDEYSAIVKVSLKDSEQAIDGEHPVEIFDDEELWAFKIVVLKPDAGD